MVIHLNDEDNYFDLLFILRKIEQTNDSGIGCLLIYFGRCRYTPKVRGQEPEGKGRGARG